MTFYASIQAVARVLARLLSRNRIQVLGTENVPRSGAFLLVANHQSFLDPVFIQGFCPRPVNSMTKSTEFASPITAPLMKRLKAFPVRRFQVDPQAVRLALRRLWAGEAVCIYIEGERSWDGRLQEPRLGALRLILKAGVPVIPCVITGSYHMLPRWGRTPRRHPIRIRFGEPLRFPKSDQRAERERLLGAAADRLMGRLSELLDESRSAAAATGSERPAVDSFPARAGAAGSEGGG